METKSKSVMEAVDNEIVVSRIINAPREMVYKACTDPKQMAQWWGPHGFTNPLCELDVRVGGKWRIHQADGAGNIYKFHGEYKEIVKNERIVWTFVFEGFPVSEALAILMLEDQGSKTLITITTCLATAEERDGMMKHGAVQGTQQSYERLEDFLTNNDIASRQLCITRLIKAPRELVWEMWTNPEHIKHWWGPNGFTNTIFKMDVKPGGEWDFIMHGPDGTNYRNTHVFQELVKNERLVLTHVSAPKFRMEVWFIQHEENTMLTIRSVFQSAEQLKEVIRVFKADVGLKQNVDKLEQYVTTVPAEKELVIMRQLNAPRELVFKAWSEPERFAQWWGPKGMDVEVRKGEMKPGGTLLYCLKNPAGAQMWGKFVYREITPPEKMVFVNSFSDEAGNTTPNPFMPTWPLEVLNTLLLTEFEGKTTLILKGKPINATAEEVKNFESFKDSMDQGFAGTFDKLEEYLSNN